MRACFSDFSFLVDWKEGCGDLLSYFTDVYYHMEFIECVLEGGNDECTCQKRQDKVLGITRKCFDDSSARTLMNNIPLSFQLIFLIMMKQYIWVEKYHTNDKSSS